MITFKNKFIEYAIKTLITIGCFSISTYFFNNINPYLGIGLFIGTLLYIGNKIFNDIEETN